MTTKYGIHQPISTDRPTEWHKNLSEQLKQLLISKDNFESRERSALREDVLGRLNNIVINCSSNSSSSSIRRRKKRRRTKRLARLAIVTNSMRSR
mmetsp:Transcript_10634/g.14736  ORF Transcript_10634/g.14736 Transcript_10634/m.14736 type:complete len:95 (-) Transcript_10634:47-331(-)